MTWHQIVYGSKNSCSKILTSNKRTDMVSLGLVQYKQARPHAITHAPAAGVFDLLIKSVRISLCALSVGCCDLSSYYDSNRSRVSIYVVYSFYPI